MLKEYFNTLSNSCLFTGIDNENISEILKFTNYRIKKYSENEIIALEGDEINDLLIVLSGDVSVEKIYITGRVVKIKKIGTGELIGHVNIFSDYNFYPSTILAIKKVSILFIPHDDIINICKKNIYFLNNLMKLISNQTLYLSQKLKFISYETIRKKLSYFILEEYKKQNKLELKIKIKRKDMAENFGVTRPALSNELIRMKKDGLIDYRKGIIEIKDIYKLESQLF